MATVSMGYAGLRTDLEKLMLAVGCKKVKSVGVFDCVWSGNIQVGILFKDGTRVVSGELKDRDEAYRFVSSVAALED